MKLWPFKKSSDTDAPTVASQSAVQAGGAALVSLFRGKRAQAVAEAEALAQQEEAAYSEAALESDSEYDLMPEVAAAQAEQATTEPPEYAAPEAVVPEAPISETLPDFELPAGVTLSDAETDAVLADLYPTSAVAPEAPTQDFNAFAETHSLEFVSQTGPQQAQPEATMPSELEPSGMSPDGFFPDALLNYTPDVATAETHETVENTFEGLAEVLQNEPQAYSFPDAMTSEAETTSVDTQPGDLEAAPLSADYSLDDTSAYALNVAESPYTSPAHSTETTLPEEAYAPPAWTEASTEDSTPAFDTPTLLADYAETPTFEMSLDTTKAPNASDDTDASMGMMEPIQDPMADFGFAQETTEWEAVSPLLDAPVSDTAAAPDMLPPMLDTEYDNAFELASSAPEALEPPSSMPNWQDSDFEVPVLSTREMSELDPTQNFNTETYGYQGEQAATPVDTAEVTQTEDAAYALPLETTSYGDTEDTVEPQDESPDLAFDWEGESAETTDDAYTNDEEAYDDGSEALEEATFDLGPPPDDAAESPMSHLENIQAEYDTHLTDGDYLSEWETVDTNTDDTAEQAGAAYAEPAPAPKPVEAKATPVPAPKANPHAHLSITDSLVDFEARTILQESHFMKRSIDHLVDSYFAQQDEAC